MTNSLEKEVYMQYKDKIKYHDRFGQTWESRYGSNCREEGCTSPVLGSKFTVCAKHHETKEQKRKLTSVLNSLGLYSPGQSLQELSAACREYLLTSEASGRLLNKIKMDS